ncbi:hypothetical protein ACFQEQ_11370 [Halolamina salina]|uniref:hypothetical protein n=1 Tax=Halolamina salina TaxID=1220023 RepID=UPI00361465A6
MARNVTVPSIGVRIGEFVARHPRLVVAIAATILLLAAQDGALAADGTLVEPADDASADPGPEPIDD